MKKKNKLIAFLNNNYPIIIIFFIWLAIVLTNFSPFSWLTGWDNLHPEFNFLANIKRSIFPAWQEYQGLGLLGGMGHAADLVRQFFLWFLSLFLPQSTLRYISTFSMLLLGAIGCIKLAQFLFKEKNTRTKNAIALLSSLFYLLNLGTLQNFYAPFEPFAWFYGFLPWLIYYLLFFLETGKKKRLFVFFIISFLATPLGYLQTAFLVYSLMIAVFLFFYLFEKQQRKTIKLKFSNKLKNISLVILTISIANAFWFLPVAYFALTSGQITVESKMNQLVTPETLQQNKNYGDLGSILQFKSYWLSLTDAKDQSTEYLLEPWITHLEQIPIRYLSLFFAGFILLGLFSLWKSKVRWKSSLIAFALLSITMLATDNPPLGFIISFLRRHIGLFEQIFRSPFTKWVVPTSLVFSLCFGIGAVSLIKFIYSQILKKSFLSYILGFTICCSVIIYSWPTFQGNFIYPQMRQEIPDAYFQLFEFFENQPKEARIAFLPAHTVYGWNFYQWGYRGSGFLWYGIEQPILDRAFDVWSAYDETFYNEVSTAIYGNDVNSFKNVLKKYHVSYILIDQSVTDFGQNKTSEIFRFGQSEQMLEIIGAKKIWQQDFLTVYDTSNSFQEENNKFIHNPEKLTIVKDNDQAIRRDYIFANHGNYISSINTQADEQSLLNISPLIYPFSNLSREEIKNISYSQKAVTFKQEINNVTDTYTLMIPAFQSQENFLKKQFYNFPAKISYNNKQINIVFDQTITVTLEGEKETQTIQLANLPELTMETPDAYQFIVLMINSQPITLQQGETIQIQTQDLVIGEPIELEVFDGQIFAHQSQYITISEEQITNKLIEAEIWDKLIQKQEIKINQKIKNISLTLPTLTTAMDLATTDPHLTYNCDVLQRGSIEKKQINEGGVSYQAQNAAVACESWELFKEKNHNSYLLRFVGENLTGRSLKFYLRAIDSQRNDLEILLPRNKFDNSYALLSWPNLKEDNYALTLETRSFGKETSKNKMENAFIYQLPLSLDWISQIVLRPKENTLIDNRLQISNIQKQGTWKYQLDVNSEDGIIVLSQAFDSGWLAFVKPVTFFQGLSYFRQPTAHSLPHLKYNSWANAWVVPEGEQKIIILYWPQLLSFMGYGLLLMTVICFALNFFFIKLKKTKKL